jgi:hypothetical protein
MQAVVGFSAVANGIDGSGPFCDSNVAVAALSLWCVACVARKHGRSHPHHAAVCPIVVVVGSGAGGGLTGHPMPLWSDVSACVLSSCSWDLALVVVGVLMNVDCCNNFKEKPFVDRKQQDRVRACYLLLFLNTLPS